jgi:hypothetical protein
MNDTQQGMPITPTEALELRTLALRLQTDLARFGDRWARRQPRSRGRVWLAANRNKYARTYPRARINNAALDPAR